MVPTYLACRTICISRNSSQFSEIHVRRDSRPSVPLNPTAFAIVQSEASNEGSRPSRKEVGSLPTPAHPTKNAVKHSHGSTRTSPHHSQNSARHASDSLWSLFCHAPQLSQTCVGCMLHGISKVQFWRRASAHFHVCVSCSTRVDQS